MNSLEGTKGVPRSGGRKQQLVRSRCTPDYSCVQAIMLTEAQTPFLGTPFVLLKSSDDRGKRKDEAARPTCEARLEQTVV